VDPARRAAALVAIGDDPDVIQARQAAAVVAEALEGAYRLWSSDRASLAHAVTEAARRFAPAGFSQVLGQVYAEALAS
jgi:hypothetical protein